jgi:hypothetical protein
MTIKFTTTFFVELCSNGMVFFFFLVGALLGGMGAVTADDEESVQWGMGLFAPLSNPINGPLVKAPLSSAICTCAIRLFEAIMKTR